MFLKSKLIFSVLFMICSNHLLAQKGSSQIYPDSTSKQITSLQKNVAAHLTGYSDESYFTARSTPQERQETAEYLEQIFHQLNITPLRHHYKMPNVNGIVDLLMSPYKGQNVYSILKSTTPNKEYVLVGAHYDSEPNTPGAIDNASGIAVTFALSNLLNQQPNRKYNYIFVLFDQEEDDEVGSKAFAQFLKQESYKIHSTHIIDSIGWGDSDTLAFKAQVSDDFTEIVYQKTATRLDISLKIVGGRGASDNKSFNLAGYHSAGFWDDKLSPHMHKPTDTYETINFERLKAATYFLFELLINLDNKDYEL